MPAAYKQLREITTRLERHYKDVQDFEFTIQENTLYMLQTRNGKRTGLAAVQIAVDMCEEGLITKKEALLKVEPQALDQLLHPIFDAKARKNVAGRGEGPARPRRARPRAPSSSPPTTRWRGRRRARRSSSSGWRRSRTTSTACPSPRAS